MKFLPGSPAAMSVLLTLFCRKIALFLVFGGIVEAREEHCEEDSCRQDSTQ